MTGMIRGFPQKNLCELAASVILQKKWEDVPKIGRPIWIQLFQKLSRLILVNLPEGMFQTMGICSKVRFKTYPLVN